MVKFWGRGEDEKKERRQHAHEIVVAHTQGRASSMGTIPNKQMIDSLGTAYFLQQDENVVDLIKQECPELLPAFSRMNATSKIEKPHDRRFMQLKFADLLLHQEMEMGDEGSLQHRSFIKSLGINAEYRIMDALGGYRGKLITEEIERTTHVIEEPKKKGIL